LAQPGAELALLIAHPGNQPAHIGAAGRAELPIEEVEITLEIVDDAQQASQLLAISRRAS
jgi:hypothetical protein